MMHFPQSCKVTHMMQIGSILMMLKFEGRFNILTFVECIQFVQKTLSLEFFCQQNPFLQYPPSPSPL
jgi:hypothetical protein